MMLPYKLWISGFEYLTLCMNIIAFWTISDKLIHNINVKLSLDTDDFSNLKVVSGDIIEEKLDIKGSSNRDVVSSIRNPVSVGLCSILRCCTTFNFSRPAPAVLKWESRKTFFTVLYCDIASDPCFCCC